VVIHRCPAKHSLHTLHVDNGSGEAAILPSNPAFLGQPKPNTRHQERASRNLSSDCHFIVEAGHEWISHHPCHPERSEELALSLSKGPAVMSQLHPQMHISASGCGRTAILK
jgi:hypothetical protein